MSGSARNSKQVETLAWVTDDEAEFWTSISPGSKPTNFNYPSLEDAHVGDGLYFKTNDALSSDQLDHLSLLYKNSIDQQVKEIEDDAEKKQISDIFQLNIDEEFNENIPGISMSFLDRLIHQITRPSKYEMECFIDDSFVDESFTEIDEAEITAAMTDDGNLLHSSSDDESRTKNNLFFVNYFRSFFDEIGEETAVIQGKLDENILLNRRSRLAKDRLSLPATYF